VVRAETPAQDLDRNAQAVARGQKGLEAFGAGDLEASYRLFSEAEALAHSPVFLLYLARVRARQGALEEALEHYERTRSEKLAENAPEAWHAAVEQATAEASEVRARLAARSDAEMRAGVKDQAVAAESPSTPHDASPEPSPEPKPRWVPNVPKQHEPSGNPTRRAAYVVLGASAVGALVGATTGLIAWLRFQPVKQRCTQAGCDPADSAIISDVHAWGRASDISFVLAGAGLATAGILFWVAPSSSRQAAPSNFGVAVTGSF
jgi:hypothetical protein